MLGVNWIFNKNMVFHLMVNSFHFVYTYSEPKRTKKNQSTCLSNCYFCKVKYSKEKLKRETYYTPLTEKAENPEKSRRK